MKSGRIENNCVTAIGVMEGFDGRGGGVLNRGMAGLYGGTISENRVSGIRSNGRDYGGVGGGLANEGDCVLGGTSIRGNTGERGSDIGAISGKLTAGGVIRLGELWLRNGQVLHVGNGFGTGGKIRLIPEKVAAGIGLVDGVSGEAWKKYFFVERSLLGNGLVLGVKNRMLRIEKKPEPTPAPVPTMPAGGGGTGNSDSGIGNSGSGNDSGQSGFGATQPTYAPVTPPPSYLPVRTSDPEAEIPLVTRVPEGSVSPAATSSTQTETTTPVVVPSPSPTVRRRALPWYLIYPMATPEPTAPVPTMGSTPSFTTAPATPVVLTPVPAETARPAVSPATNNVTGTAVSMAAVTSVKGDVISWHFSKEEIRDWKQRIRREGIPGDEESCERFLGEIRKNEE